LVRRIGRKHKAQTFLTKGVHPPKVKALQQSGGVIYLELSKTPP
jgi:hypothetical protein